MARARAADYNDKRNGLLEIATRLFAHSGFDRTSVSEIAHEAGVSKALLYHYYRSKDALLFDIIHNHLVHLLAQIARADDAALPPREHLAALIRAILFAYRDADLMHKVQINELDKLPAASQKIIRSLERDIVAIVARALQRVNPQLAESGHSGFLKPVAMSLFGIVNWSYLWFREDKALSREAYADMVTRLFIDGLFRFACEKPPVQIKKLRPKLASSR